MSEFWSVACVRACERGQRDDVYRGVVFDGLDSVFASSCVHTLHSVLKALNNRKYIFAVTLKNDFNTIKQQQKRVQAEKGGYWCTQWTIKNVAVYL